MEASEAVGENVSGISAVPGHGPTATWRPLGKSSASAVGGPLHHASAQENTPPGLAHHGGVTHFSNTTSHKTWAKCGRFRATKRVRSPTAKANTVTCHNCDHAAATNSL